MAWQLAEDVGDFRRVTGSEILKASLEILESPESPRDSGSERVTDTSNTNSGSGRVTAVRLGKVAPPSPNVVASARESRLLRCMTPN